MHNYAKEFGYVAMEWVMESEVESFTIDSVITPCLQGGLVKCYWRSTYVAVMHTTTTIILLLLHVKAQL